jgi:HAD superfamily hydrolase (TIGR01509 family)
MIKCIIFDWDGLFSLNKFNWSAKQLGMTADLLTQIERDHFNIKPYDVFLKILKEISKSDKTLKEIDDIFNKEYVYELFEFLDRIKDYKVILLSDQATCRTNFLRKKYKKYIDKFDVVFFSNEIGRSKKEKETFRWVLNQIGFKAEECLFTDDSQENIDNANSVGINTIHYKSKDQFLKDLNKFGVKYD